MSNISLSKNQYHSGVRCNVERQHDSPNFKLRVNVQDEDLRQVVQKPHDGYEKAFALMPMKDGSLQRFDLHFEGQSWTRFSPPSDNHGASIDPLNSGVSLDRLYAEGVAFGLEITGSNGEDPTTVWLQYRDDNYKPGE